MRDHETQNARAWDADSVADDSTVAGSTAGDREDHESVQGDTRPLIEFAFAEISPSPPVLEYPQGQSSLRPSGQPAPRYPPGLSITPLREHRFQGNNPAQQPSNVQNHTTLGGFDRLAYGHPGPRPSRQNPGYRNTSGVDLQLNPPHRFTPSSKGRPQNANAVRTRPGSMHGNAQVTPTKTSTMRGNLKGTPTKASKKYSTTQRRGGTHSGVGIVRTTSEGNNLNVSGKAPTPAARGPGLTQSASVPRLSGPRFQYGSEIGGSTVDTRFSHRKMASTSNAGRASVAGSIPYTHGYTGQLQKIDLVPATRWAVLPKLETGRKVVSKGMSAANQQDRGQFLKAPAQEEHFATMGYYLWPLPNEGPASLLGWRMETLNPLRVDYRVFIESNAEGYCINISSREPGQDLKPVIDGIRLAVQHAHAKRIMATNVYFVVPPNGSAMKTIVRPRESRPAPDKFAKFLELAGEDLSPTEKKEWDEDRGRKVLEYRKGFQDHLLQNLKLIEPLKGWMRMRIMFGHVELTAYYKGFAASAVSYEKFLKMVGEPRQTGTFDKKIRDAKIVMKLKDEIVKSDHPRFVAAHGSTQDLRDIKFKNTEVIFITTSGGQGLRVEAEIDRVYEYGTLVYQIGSVHLYRHDNSDKARTTGRNKLIQMTTIDIEKEIDYKLDVKTDEEVASIPSEIYQLIKDSISAKSDVREDGLGLEYPQVKPRATSQIRIDKVVVRSDILYKLRDSGYIVEIAIYRSWAGTTSTRGEPVMEASVSMFHPLWDEWMESIENTSRFRDFGGSGLNNLFPSSPDWTGMEMFFRETTAVQSLLVKATQQRAFQVRAAALAAGEVGRERI
ncbi:hypothetical protein LZ554_005333 [Drepanopeziza brunnea f. sp. 'monogermtubi']|nr:hypothetical protein LZ554_005333 [Drepanopeziza brunnea f. sp. 'monogermtubi']